MLLKGKAISELIEQDLINLISEGETEGKTLDFKRDICDSSPSNKKEFLADISSFANASGGYIIYGMDEQEGQASDLLGISGINPDQEILRLENIIRDGIAPRITGISTHAIKLSNGNYALVIQIPNSWATPHMVTFQGTSRFFSRNSAGKYQMDVNEIRQAFLLSQTLNERIRNFRLDRLNKIFANEMPILMIDGAKIVMHCIPLTAFQLTNVIDINDAAKRAYELRPIYNSPSGYRFNLDGLLTYSDPAKADSYVQLFRDGTIEAVNSYILRGRTEEKFIPSIAFEKAIIEASKGFLNFQRQLGLEPPIFIFLSLLGVAGYVMGVKDPWRYDISQQTIDRDVLLFPEIMIENYPADDLPNLLKPLFDMVWNAAGWPKSLNYNNEGYWKP